MNRAILLAAVSLLPLAALNSEAHHPPRFERCKSFTVTGQLERLEWTNPHVSLSIRGDDGTTYSLQWRNMQQLAQAGIDAQTLRIGDRLVVTAGGRADDAVKVPMLLSEIRRPADGWQWAQPPQGC